MYWKPSTRYGMKPSWQIYTTSDFLPTTHVRTPSTVLSAKWPIRCHMGYHQSKHHPIITGFRQGSPISSIVYNLYTNYVPMTNGICLAQFSDDFMLYTSVRCLSPALRLQNGNTDRHHSLLPSQIVILDQYRPNRGSVSLRRRNPALVAHQRHHHVLEKSNKNLYYVTFTSRDQFNAHS